MNIKHILEKKENVISYKNTDRPENIPELSSTQQKQEFYSRALSKFGNIMRWQEGQTLQSWSENLLQQLVPFVGGLQGALYYMDSQSEELIFSCGFAIDFENALKKSYKPGEGLIGQVAKNQEIMTLSDNKDFVSISSTKKIRLKYIIVIPLLYNSRTIGVIEMNFPQNPKEKYHNFLTQISDSIASNLNALVKEQQLAQSFKKIKASEERLKKLAEVTTEGIIFLDDERRITEYNSAFQKIFGYEQTHEIKGKKIADFLQLQEHDLELEEKISKDIPYEAIGIRKDGSTFYVELQERDTVYYTDFFHIINIRDISKRKETETNLRHKEAQLREAQRIVELSKIIRKKNKDITASITYAKRIQDAFLTETEVIREYIPESFIFFKPKDIVSGDFYFFAKKENKLILAAIDCTGHGVPGAIMSMAGNTFLKQIINLQEITHADEILTKLNDNIQKSLQQKENRNRDGMDAALCVIDKSHQTLEFAGAKNSLIYIQNGELTEIEGDKMPIGGFLYQNERSRIFRKKIIPLQRGQQATFYIFTDGFEDQFGGEEGRKFMKARLRDLLLEIHEKPMQEQQQILENTITAWMQNQKQIDDMLIIGFKI